MIGHKIHNYIIEKKLGEGGIGEVYLGVHEFVDRKVAIKVLNPFLSKKEEIRKRFRNEAKTLFNIEHPNIVRLNDYYEQDDLVCLIMEFIDGLPLDEYVSRLDGKVPIDDVIFIFKQILQGMDYAHQKNIIHRDIKPSNLIISENNEVKILDFGIAKILNDEDYELTRTGVKIGTVLYMSPEMVLGKETDAQSDIHSLGLTLFQLLTGKYPYEKSLTEFEIYQNIVNEVLPDPREYRSEIPSYLCDLIRLAIKKEKDERIKDIKSFLSFIEDKEVTSLIGEITYTDTKKNKGFFVDPRDGKKYTTIKIGNQIWMAENLAYIDRTRNTKYVEEKYEWSKNYKKNAWCYSNIDSDNDEERDVIYQWEAALKSPPPGWHLPTEEEGRELIDYINNILKTSFVRNKPVDHVDIDVFFGSDDYRNSNGNYKKRLGCVSFWSKSSYNLKNATNICIMPSDTSSIEVDNKLFGFSVRCIKD